MAKLTLSDVTSGYVTAVKINANSDLIEAAVENTLSRDGASPNEMNANLDMNSHAILNLPDAVNNQSPVTLAQAGSILDLTPVGTREQVGGLLWPRTSEEVAGGLVPTYYYYEPGDLRRYGAVFDDSSSGVKTANSALFNSAVQTFKNTGIPIRIVGGSEFNIGDQLQLQNDLAASIRLNIIQDRNCVIMSHVTGSIAGYDTAGFAILVDGLRDSTWENLALDYSNGTAGIVMRCRKNSCVRNDFKSPRIFGGIVVGDRLERTRISLRFTGNESASSSPSWACYWNRFIGGVFNIARRHVDFLVGDGSASTMQPNAQVFLGTQFERYIEAFDFDDSDEHFVNGAWFATSTADAAIGTASSVTQAAGTATFNLTDHGLETGDIVSIAGANQSAYNGRTRITKVNADSFTYTITNGVAIPGGTTSPATGTITVTLTPVAFRGNTTYSQLGANIESGVGTIAYFIESGGSGGNLFNIIQNNAFGGVIENSADENVIIDRQYYSASGRWVGRIGATELLGMTTALASFSVPLYLASDIEIDGALNHDGTTVGFFGTAPVTKGAAVTAPSGGATQDAEARTAINTIISRLQAYGLLS